MCCVWLEWSCSKNISAGLLAATCRISADTFHDFCAYLAHGGIPLCTRFAEAMHGPLTPPARRLRTPGHGRLDFVFCRDGPCVHLALLLALLATWSVFGQFVTLPLVALMFIAEYWLRRSVLTEMRPAHLLDALASVQEHRGASALIATVLTMSLLPLVSHVSPHSINRLACRWRCHPAPIPGRGQPACRPVSRRKPTA